MNSEELELKSITGMINVNDIQKIIGINEILWKKNEQLHSIIKEVREYIEEHTTHYTSYLGKPKVVPKIELQREAYDKLINLLDKVSDKE